MLNQRQIENIISFAIDAGEIAIKERNQGNFQVRKKSDNSEVSSADIILSDFIDQKLKKEFPQIKIVCEEKNLRKFEDEIFWLVDPIDGTSSFVSGGDEFAINIALIKNNKPIFGLIYAPIFEGGKFAFLNSDNKAIISDKKNNRKELEILKNNANSLNIITSKRVSDVEIQNFVAQFYPNFLHNFSVNKISSAVKFFHILEGRVNLLLGLRETMEWDIASGHALIDSVGGELKKLTMQNSSYLIEDNMSYKKANFKNPFFIAQTNASNLF